MNIQSLIEACEKDLREGRTAAAAASLRELKGKDVPRSSLPTVANLCRRSNLDKQSLRLLSPFVRSEVKNVFATPEETAEYAAALLKIGGVTEAMALLNGRDVGALPQSSLFLSFCHFRRWEYAEAVPLLERYVARAPSEYAALVGQMNLAAALAVAREYEKSLALTARLMPELSARKFHRLLANAFELRAQVQISAGDWAAAKESLAEGFSVSGETFYLRKWNTLLLALEGGGTGGIGAFREEARAAGDWESLREADYFELKIAFNDGLFRALIAGTPHAAYRARVANDLGRAWTPSSFALPPASIPPRGQIAAVVKALLRDRYSPPGIGALFAEIFPQEHFNVFTSPNRVHQLLFRAREWLRDSRTRASLEENNGHFSLAGEGFVIRAEAESGDPRLKMLADKFAAREFTNEEAMNVLKISASSCKRLVRRAVEDGVLARRGASRATSYVFSGANRATAALLLKNVA